MGTHVDVGETSHIVSPRVSLLSSASIRERERGELPQPQSYTPYILNYNYAQYATSFFPSKLFFQIENLFELETLTVRNFPF